MGEISGYVFNIQRFSIHDGPGIRTTVFLKGCPLHCFWCHNPEGLHPKLEIQFYPEKCILCGECVKICEHAAHTIQGDLHLYNRDLCVTCGECVQSCYTGAVQLTGETMSVERVVTEILRDRTFYETSGGGVTLSGGEPMLQREFTFKILRQCKEEEVHTAIETTANCRWDHLEEMLPVTDMFMMDIKHMDSEKHREVTGVPNKLILANARRLAQTGKPMIFRTPVIPTVNDSPDDIGAIAHFVHELAHLREDPERVSLELLPFHRMAGDKYRSLGLEYQANHLNAPTKDKMSSLVEVAREFIPETISR